MAEVDHQTILTAINRLDGRIVDVGERTTRIEERQKVTAQGIIDNKDAIRNLSERVETLDNYATQGRVALKTLIKVGAGLAAIGGVVIAIAKYIGVKVTVSGS